MTNSTYLTPSSIPLHLVMAVGVVVFWSMHYDAEQPMPVPSQEFTPKIGSSYVPVNAGADIRVNSSLTGDSVVDNYRPRTELGRKLLALRRAYVIAGGQLLDDEALDAEVQLRRGGLRG
ncbi:MAG: hypothetical protein FWG26_07720 [Betaproteobacteria bacterium]|nr:hypothetical protein [Betaproteobacteria bacterium]